MNEGAILCAFQAFTFYVVLMNICCYVILPRASIYTPPYNLLRALTISNNEKVGVWRLLSYDSATRIVWGWTNPPVT